MYDLTKEQLVGLLYNRPHNAIAYSLTSKSWIKSITDHGPNGYNMNGLMVFTSCVHIHCRNVKGGDTNFISFLKYDQYLEYGKIILLDQIII